MEIANLKAVPRRKNFAAFDMTMTDGRRYQVEVFLNLAGKFDFVSVRLHRVNNRTGGFTWAQMELTQKRLDVIETLRPHLIQHLDKFDGGLPQ